MNYGSIAVCRQTHGESRAGALDTLRDQSSTMPPHD
jgi:hypothetical protein